MKGIIIFLIGVLGLLWLSGCQTVRITNNINNFGTDSTQNVESGNLQEVAEMAKAFTNKAKEWTKNQRDKILTAAKEAGIPDDIVAILEGLSGAGSAAPTNNITIDVDMSKSTPIELSPDLGGFLKGQTELTRALAAESQARAEQTRASTEYMKRKGDFDK